MELILQLMTIFGMELLREPLVCCLEADLQLFSCVGQFRLIEELLTVVAKQLIRLAFSYSQEY